MKKLLQNTLILILATFIVLLITASQRRQAVGDYEPMTAEEHRALQQAYQDYIEGRE